MLDTLVDGRARDARKLETVGDVLADALPWHEAEVLEDHRHLAAGRAHLNAVDHDAAGVDLREPMHAPKQRRLPAPRRAEDAEGLAVPHREVEILEHGDGAGREPLRHVLD